MSDQSQGPGWWLASDGKWYPPTDAPGPGWWKASDGNWYPPEQAGAAAGEPATPASPVPADPAPGSSAPTAGPKRSLGPLLAAGAVAVVLVVLVAGFVVLRGRGSTPPTNGVPVGVDEPPASSLTLADGAVVVRSDNGAAVKELSGDGSRIVLADGAAGAGDLQPGKAMILTGVTAVKVKDVKRENGQVVVTAEPASLTDLIRDGSMQWDQTPADLGKASLRLYEPTPDLVTQTDQEGSLGPLGGNGGGNDDGHDGGTWGDRVVPPSALGLAPPPEGESAAAYVDIPLAQADGQPVSRSGTLGDYRYDLNATIGGDSIRFVIDLTTDKFGFAVAIHAEGNVQGVGFAGNIDISASTVRNFRLDTANLSGSISIRAEAAAGPQASRIPVEVLRLPMSVQIPFPVYGIPFTIGIDASARLEITFTSRDAAVSGSLTARYDGSGGLSVSDGTFNTSGAFNPTFDDPIGSIQGASIAPAAVLVTIQFPKVSLGVGFSLARASAYISAVYSFSPLVSGVTNITPCRAAPLNIVVKAGYTAEFLGHEVAAADRKLGEVSASPIDPPIKACEF